MVWHMAKILDAAPPRSQVAPTAMAVVHDDAFDVFPLRGLSLQPAKRTSHTLTKMPTVRPARAFRHARYLRGATSDLDKAAGLRLASRRAIRSSSKGCARAAIRPC